MKELTGSHRLRPVAEASGESVFAPHGWNCPQKLRTSLGCGEAVRTGYSRFRIPTGFRPDVGDSQEDVRFDVIPSSWGLTSGKVTRLTESSQLQTPR